MKYRGKLIVLLYISFLFLLNYTVFAQDSDENLEEIEEYFDGPFREGNVVYTVFTIPLENSGDDIWAEALLLGFFMTFDESEEGDILGVAFIFTEEDHKVYYVERNIFFDLQNDNISIDRSLQSLYDLTLVSHGVALQVLLYRHDLA